MKNITILAVALMGVTVSACGDKKAKMTKTLTTECTRVIAMMEDDDIPAGFCSCFSEKIAETVEPVELATVTALFKDAKSEDDIEEGFERLDKTLMNKIEDIPDACGA